MIKLSPLWWYKHFTIPSSLNHTVLEPLLVDVCVVGNDYLELIAQHLHHIMCQSIHQLNLLSILADSM